MRRYFGHPAVERRRSRAASANLLDTHHILALRSTASEVAVSSAPMHLATPNNKWWPSGRPSIPTAIVNPDVHISPRWLRWTRGWETNIWLRSGVASCRGPGRWPTNGRNVHGVFTPSARRFRCHSSHNRARPLLHLGGERNPREQWSIIKSMR